MTHQCHYPHVPECRHLITGAFIFKTDDYPDRDPHDDSLCGYCASLRACEARVLERNARAFDVAVVKHLMQEQYAAGVQAARDAVAAAYDDPAPMKDGMTLREEIAEMYGRKVMFEDAIDAIDALKEDAK